MSWVSLLIFLIALPFSVWMLANTLSILDQHSKSKPIIRLLISAAGIALFLNLTHRDYWVPIAIAFCIVLALHAISGWLLRRSLGAPSYVSEAQKSVVPDLEDEDEEPDLEDQSEPKRGE